MWLYIWLFFTALALIIEFITNDLVSIWFVGGGIIGMILSACGVPWAIQVVAFLIVSFVLLFTLRKIILKRFKGQEVNLNADRAIGKSFRLLSAITFDDAGSIKVNDVMWTVVSKNNMPIPAGKIVKVVEIKGNKYIVELEENDL